MNKEIRQILENQKAKMNYLLNPSMENKENLLICLGKTSVMLNKEESKELPTEMPEEDEE